MAAGIVHAVKLESTSVASTFTINNFTPPAGNDKRIGVLILGARASGNTTARSVTSVVWNAVNFNSRAQATSTTGTAVRAAYYDLAIGTSTTTSNLTVTLNASAQGAIVYAIVFEDVEQGTPTPTAISSNNLSDSISLSALGLAIDMITNCANASAGDFSLTAATQSQISLSPSRTGAGTTNEQNMGSSAVVGSGSLTFGWTATASPNRAHLIVGYLQASASSTPAPTALVVSGGSVLSFAVRARASIVLTVAGASAMTAAARGAACSSLSVTGDSGFAASVQARAQAAMQVSGVSAASFAVRARAIVALWLAGTSEMAIATGAGFVRSAARTLFIGREDRRLSIEREDRELRVAAENRRLEIEP